MRTLLLVVCAATVWSCTAGLPPAPKDELPNILFILTDDQGIGDLSLHGNDSIRTPNLDELLAAGAKFDRFYVSPVCAPTRASFLSGLYHPRTGAVFVTRRRETMDDAVKTIPEYFKDAGYRSGLFGKWHNGATKPYDPAGQGFDEFLGFSLGHFNDYFNGQLENERDEVVPFSGDLTDILTDTAAAFMLADDDRPFFTMLAYQAPHTPVQVADDHWGKVNERGLSTYNTGIYAMIESIDEQVGRLLGALDTAGVLDNTVVIYSSDNGPNGDRYRMGLRGTKGQVDEGGVRVPFAIRFPPGHELAEANGTRIDAPAAHIDLLPTLLDLVGSAPAGKLDGRSLRPLLGGEADDALTTRPVYAFKQGYDYTGYPGSVRSQDALVVMRGKERAEWYDLAADPGQRIDLKSAPDDLARGRRSIFERLESDYRLFAPTLARPDLVAPPIDLDAAADVFRFQAHEGEPAGKTTFAGEGGYGWANDYFTGIDSSGACWPIQTSEDREYDVTIHYALKGIMASTQVLGSDKGESITLSLPPAEAPRVPVADRIKRKEVYPRAWATAERSSLMIPAGSTKLLIRTDNEAAGLEIKEITIYPLKL